ncbi:DNA-binding transcriptional MocR family regulator [Povalibacter uvarum]|uniref:DNA-binding transcriptional MocR family regulator n=1 Tax=Povalibacter uvarum TaxID=732238 RepID=A0A841HSB8_9GAMM|nr:PLP-dependent aminotransferase family protein [Povalibacter uvarum]MBB6095100.1 DNA-binding transcriptional MocR family regulator [Povalibacter uvarum]
MSAQVPSQAPLLYERVAHLVETQIATGTLRANDRIPSVRSMSRAAKVSVSTVVQAYVHLENIGLIEARPQSGFYVRPPDPKVVPEPRAKPLRSRRPASIATEMLDICREALTRSDIVPLNGAFTSPALYPNQRLNNLVREVLRDRPHHAGELIMPPGDPELRRQIAKRMGLAGAPTDPEHVVITSGAMDAITLSLRVVCQPGDTVLVESPTYFGLLQAIEYLGLKVVEVPNRPGVGIDADAVRQVARTTRLAAAVLMPNFNNPAGTLTTDDAKRDIVATLTGMEVPIIEDDLYGDLHYGSVRPTSMRAFDESGLVISCGSVSKTIALGYRIGWAVAPQFHTEIARAKFFASVACPTLQQLVLARYYASGGYDRYLRRIRTMLSTNSQHFIDAVARHFPAGTRITRPTGGIVIWIELPPSVDGAELFRTALASRIGIAPGIVFSAKADYRNYIRMSCGLPWSAAIDRAIEKLGKLAKDRSG